MKVIGIGGSLRRNSNSEYYVRYTLDKPAAEGMEAE